MNLIHNIILLDFNTDFSELDILNFSESEIISFDYETHQQLDIRNLKHIISDNFLVDFPIPKTKTPSANGSNVPE